MFDMEQIKDIGLIYRASKLHFNEVESVFNRIVCDLTPKGMYRSSNSRITHVYKNGFSIFFYALYLMAGMNEDERTLCGVINNSLRMIITGTDNILDDDDLHYLVNLRLQNSPVMTSVMDVILAEKIIAHVLLSAAEKGFITYEKAALSQKALFHRLSEVGLNEAEEVQVQQVCYEPEEILEKVHHCKSGLLFTLPFVIPGVLFKDDPEKEKVISRIESGAYDFGIAVQILDDLADIGEDLSGEKPNYICSLIKSNSDKEISDSLLKKLSSTAKGRICDLIKEDSKIGETERMIISDSIAKALLQVSRLLKNAGSVFDTFTPGIQKKSFDFLVQLVYQKVSVPWAMDFSVKIKNRESG
jgi:hypothetical protein